MDTAVRQPRSCRVMRSSIRINLVIAALVALLVVGFTAAPGGRGAAALPRPRSSTPTSSSTACAPAARSRRAAPASGYGSGRFSAYREPLDFSEKISNKIAFTYSARIATAGQCRHDLGSTTDQRFRTVGLRDDTNGENLACHWAATPRRMVVYWMRHWYKETSYGGAHWHQIKDPDFRVAGFGVARHPQRPHDPRRQLLRQARRLTPGSGGLPRRPTPTSSKMPVEELLDLDDLGLMV